MAMRALLLLPLALLITGPAAAAPPATGAARGDSTVAAAADALARGQPWRASRLLAPVLRDSARRTPAAVLLGAQAAAAWNGWAEVRDLLSGERWLDSAEDGAGRTLLARADLELGRDTVALADAQAAVAAAREGRHRSPALVLLARALDRLRADSAAAEAYARAAAGLPAIADWLVLRSATVRHDSAARARLYAGLTSSAARARVPWTEAAALERAGDSASAAARYEQLGAVPASLALRAGLAHDSGSAATMRDTLAAYVAAHPATAAARQVVETLDRLFPSLPPAAELAVARALVAIGPSQRAADGFGRAFAAGLGEAQDHLDAGDLLTRLGRYDDARAQYALVKEPRKLAALAAYGAARALVRDGKTDAARTALTRVVKQFPRDTTASASALYLLADLAADDRHDGNARDRLRELAHRYPTNRFAPTARFRAALIAYTGGHRRAAAAEFDTLARRYPLSDEAAAARYWAGRAWAEARDTARANAEWRKLAAGDPQSYYVGASAQRLGLPTWMPAAAADSFASFPDLDSALARAAMLEQVGMDVEAGWEYDAMIRAADASVDRLLATAAALRARGRSVSSIQLARRALARGATPDARLYRLLYPLARRDALLAEAGERGLDPTFVAALIRQESMFDPRATSGAGARGLMQVMPDVGRALAQTLGFPVWDPVLLYQADVNLQLGAAHLRELASRYSVPVEILAAYNAGASRVEKWKTRIGAADPELFAERIPFPETRDYVRIISRNQALYRVLYEWPTTSADVSARGGGE
jgi:soluble lytic murein transglycosylase